MSDTVEGIYRLFSSDYDEPVNIGNPNEFTVKQLAELVVELTGSSAGIKLEPLPEDDPKVRQPDISLARSQLGWDPEVSLEDGLRRTLEHFSQTLEGLHST